MDRKNCDATKLEKPRFVIVGFKSNRKDIANANAFLFDNVNIRNVTLYLNSQAYPYGQINFDYANHHFSLLYEMYTNFQSAYYGKENEQMMKKGEFMNQGMLVVIDCSKQNETLKSGPVDVKIEIKTRVNLPENASAYCLILHDRMVNYRPLTSEVVKRM